MDKITAFFADVKKEAARVTWPTRQETIMTSVMVLILSAVMAVFFLIVDWILAEGTRLLVSIKL